MSRTRYLLFGCALLALALSLSVSGSLGQGAAEKIWVPIVNQFLTPEELRAEIEREGTVVVADWTYLGLTESQFTPAFEQFVRDKYGADITVKWLGNQAGRGAFIAEILAALSAGQAPTIDVVHLEKNFFDFAQVTQAPDGTVGIAEPFLPSPLVPNLLNVDAKFIKLPYGVAFQATALRGPTVNVNNAPFFKRWTDLADPRLKGKVLMPTTSDLGFVVDLVAIARTLALDAGDIQSFNEPAEQQQENIDRAIQFFVEQIDPNVLAYSSDEGGVMQQLFQGVVDVVEYWNPFGRQAFLAGRPELQFIVPEPGGIALNGWAWIPKGAAHPVLAQLVVDFLLDPIHQFPPLSDLIDESGFAIVHEGLLGEAYEQYIPDFIADDYLQLWFPFDTIKNQLNELDWTFIEQHSEQWIRQFEDALRSKG